MTTPRHKSGRAFSARRLILLATAGNLAIAALLVGPDSFRHSVLPTFSAANAAEVAASSRGWIGVQIQPITSAIAESLGMKESKGALVAEPMADSPAAKAGIQSRDVITAVNGNPVEVCSRPRHTDRRYGARRCGECHDLARGCGQEHLARRSARCRRSAPPPCRSSPRPAPTCRSSA